MLETMQVLNNEEVHNEGTNFFLHFSSLNRILYNLQGAL